MRQEFVEVSTIEAAYTACPWAAEIVEVEAGTEIEITREALDSGKIVHTGWAPNRDTADQCGVNVSDYFDLTGKFLGPDENGLAPTFKRA